MDRSSIKEEKKKESQVLTQRMFKMSRNLPKDGDKEFSKEEK